MPDADLDVTTRGSGPPVLVLHGGRGPASVRDLATRLSADHEVLLPTHPGWDGRPRIAGTSSVAGLARRYAALLLDTQLSDVTVVASSFGGWVAVELALLAPRAVVGRLVLLNPVGPAPTDAELERSHPAGAPGDPDPSLDLVRSYTGPAMTSPDLSGRLGAVRQPVLILWGADDPVLPVAYGRRMAAELADATCTVLPDAGHLPHVDRPEETMDAIRAFLPGSRTTVSR